MPIAVIVVLMLNLAACRAQSSSDLGVEKIEPIKPRGTEVNLTLTGYNYTNRSIDDFSVDGQGGGNIHVSGPGGGGGGDVCCVSYITGVKKWTLNVRWQVDACRYNQRLDSSGQELFELYSFYKEAEVKIDPNIADRPNYLEIHFYPDGHVEAAVTEHSSPPRLILSKDREDKSHFKQCKNGKRPEE